MNGQLMEFKALSIKAYKLISKNVNISSLHFIIYYLNTTLLLII